MRNHSDGAEGLWSRKGRTPVTENLRSSVRNPVVLKTKPILTYIPNSYPIP